MEVKRLNTNTLELFSTYAQVLKEQAFPFSAVVGSVYVGFQCTRGESTAWHRCGPIATVDQGEIAIYWDVQERNYSWKKAIWVSRKGGTERRISRRSWEICGTWLMCQDQEECLRTAIGGLHGWRKGTDVLCRLGQSMWKKPTTKRVSFWKRSDNACY